MARTMDDLRAPGTSWGDEVRKYELEKRRCIDEGLVRGTQVRVAGGHNKHQGRAFDPVLQRYRDPSMETQHLVTQDKDRVVQLNKAQDLQISREQPFHIINHTSKVEAIAPGMDIARLVGKRRTAHGKGSIPAVDYNILSNLSLDVHHWDRQGCGPTVSEREPKPRTVPAHTVKDFDVLTNRYFHNHDERARCEKDLNLREAAHKYAKSSRFDPITQQFNDPRAEERARCNDDAREAEADLRYQAKIPLAMRSGLSSHYNILAHAEKDQGALRAYDQQEGKRRARYKNCHVMEQIVHAQDYREEQLQQQRCLNRAAPERYFSGAVERGHDLVTNQTFGTGPHQKILHKPLARPRKDPWQKVTSVHSSTSPGLPAFTVTDSSGPAGDTMGHGVSVGLSSAASAPALLRPSPGSRAPSASGSAPQLRQPPCQDAEHRAPPGGTAAPFALMGGATPQLRGTRRPASEHSLRSSAEVSLPSRQALASASLAGTGTTPAAYSSGRFGASREAPPAPRVPGASPAASAYSRPIASMA